MQVITNNIPRDVVFGYELTAKETAQFDYYSHPDDFASATFCRYRGEVYDLSEFMAAPDSLKPWDGYSSDSYFSGVVVRYVDDCERVIVGRYYS